MIDDGRDPDDEHYDAPAYHYPGDVMDILFAGAWGERIFNPAISEMLRWRDVMEYCCEHCSRELYDDDGA